MSKNKEFELFKSECAFWIGKFGLGGWNIDYAIIDNKELEAQTWYSIVDRQVTFRLASTAIETPELNALHEVAELLVARISFLMTSNHVEDWIAEEARHAIIQRLVNIIYPLRSKL